jgi:hypothetical protein
MKAQDAKFILRAHRADGRYRADDPLFAEAQAAAASDPALADWLQHEHALDGAIAEKLEGVCPPAGLRDAILVGARASQLSRRWWRNPVWFAAAASIAVVLAIGTIVTRPTPARATATDLAEFSIDQLAFERHQHARSAGVAALEASLSASAEPLCQSLGLDCARLAEHGCLELSFAGQRVYEVCFQRNGHWYHLYVTTRPAGEADARDMPPRLVERNGYAAAMWSRGATVFAVATKAGPEALESVL